MKRFTKYLLEMISYETGCAVQYKGSSCNACFHAWSEDKLKLRPELGHMFWLIYLSLRGDTGNQKELLQINTDNFKEWSKLSRTKRQTK